MKVLIVTNYKTDNRISYFVADQIEAISNYAPDIHIEVFGKRGSGFLGYLRNRKRLLEKIRDFQPDVVHAHYGFCGALTCMQCRVPVVTTYHGSDINKLANRLVSYFAIFRSRFNIFVSEKLRQKPICAPHATVLPCGVSTDKFYPMSQDACRKQVNLNSEDKYVLFPASRTSKVKNFTLAKNVIDCYNGLHNTHLHLIELDGLGRDNVPFVLNAVDAVLMTSFSEGSPQVIKEAIACGTPIVSVPVGDVEEMTEHVPNAFVSKTYNELELESLLQKALVAQRFLEGKTVLQNMGYANAEIAKKIVEIYNRVI